METQKKDSMVFYRSFYEALKCLPDEVKAEVYDAIFSFGLDFAEPVFKNTIAESMFKLIRPQIEANNKRYFNGKQPKNKQKESKVPANENVNENVNVNVNDKVLVSVETSNTKRNNKISKPYDERLTAFRDSLVEIMTDIKYKAIPKETFKNFFEYWTEKNSNGLKMRFEMEKVFNIERRLNNWLRMDKSFKKEVVTSTRAEVQDAVKNAFAEKIKNSITNGK